MGERLDAAARISARTVRAASRTPLGMQVKESLLFYRRVARAAVTEAISRPPQAIEPQQAPHPGMQRQPAAEFVAGDDERCSCRRPAWCGATKGDIVHDLMSRGMRLERVQAETIWREAQDRRTA